MNVPPLQIVAVIFKMDGLGSIVTVTVNDTPVQLAVEGVTV